MTKDEIIEMAEFCFEKSKNQTEFVQLFAKLVAEHERRACAKLLEDAADDAKKIEPNGFVWKAVQKSAELIRARGQV